MEVSCKNCGKLHSLANDAVKNKKVYFFCSGCGKKIVIDNRKTDTENTGVSKRVTSSAEPEVEESFYSIKNILSGITLSFNFSAIMLSLIYSLSFVIIIAMIGLFFSKNQKLLLTNPYMSGSIIIFTFCILYYGYNLLLYLISKIHFFKMDNPDVKKIDWSNIFFDFKDDSLALFIITIGIGLLLVFILLPISILQTYGLVYSGIFFPIFFILSTIIIISFLLRNFIPAFIASKSRYLSDFFREFFAFLRIEMLNIPFYLVAIEIVYFFTFSIVLLIFGLSLFVTSSSIFAMMSFSLKQEIMMLPMTIQSLFSASSVPNTTSGQIKAGIAIFMIILFIAFLFLWAININIRQALYTQATHIMQVSPGKSVNKSKMLAILTIIFFGLIIFYGIILLVVGVGAGLGAKI